MCLTTSLNQHWEFNGCLYTGKWADAEASQMFYYKMDHMVILSKDCGMQSNIGRVRVTGTQSVIVVNTQWWWQSCAVVNFRCIWKRTGSFSTVFVNTDSGDDSASVHLVWVDLFNVWSHWHLAPSHTYTFTSINTPHTHLHSVKAGTHSTLAFALELLNTGGKHHQ